VAVKVIDVPEHEVCEPEVIAVDTDGVIVEVTVTATVFEVALQPNAFETVFV
jgi:hypothetical protein